MILALQRIVLRFQIRRMRYRDDQEPDELL